MPTKPMAQDLIDKIRELKSQGLTNQVISSQLGVSMGSVSKFASGIKAPRPLIADKPHRESASSLATEAHIDEKVLDDEDTTPEVREAVQQKQEIKTSTAIIEAESSKMEAEIKRKKIAETYAAEILGAGAQAVDPVQQMSVLATAMSTMIGTLISATRQTTPDNSNSSEIQQLRAQLEAEREARHQIELSKLSEKINQLSSRQPTGQKGEFDIISEGLAGVIGELKSARSDFHGFLMQNPEILKRILPAGPPVNALPAEQKKILISGLREQAAQIQPDQAPSPSPSDPDLDLAGESLGAYLAVTGSMEG